MVDKDQHLQKQAQQVEELEAQRQTAELKLEAKLQQHQEQMQGELGDLKAALLAAQAKDGERVAALQAARSDRAAQDMACRQLQQEKLELQHQLLQQAQGAQKAQAAVQQQLEHLTASMAALQARPAEEAKPPPSPTTTCSKGRAPS